MKNQHKNIIKYNSLVTREQRFIQNNHKSVVLWFTGLSGSGKSTLAFSVEEQLHQLGCRTVVLDGDNIRHGLCTDLGFSNDDRKENIRRIGEISKLFIENGVITLVAFISPFEADRDKVRHLILSSDFFEIHVDCPVAVCEKRDTKGFYKRARAGEIDNFTGISSIYEPPKNPEITVNTDLLTPEESVDLIMQMIMKQDILDKINKKNS